jgi:dTDP-D-glucose 4,6-dehydratase
MKKYLITGYSGFVSRHFLEYIDKNKTYASIKGLDLQKPEFLQDSYKNISVEFEKIDLLEQNRVESIIFNFQTDYIIHLASYSRIAFIGRKPSKAFKIT